MSKSVFRPELKNIVNKNEWSFLFSPFLPEDCKSPTEVPNFELISKYRKNGKSRGVVKQALAPLGTALNKLSQQRKRGLWSYFPTHSTDLISSEPEVVIKIKLVKPSSSSFSLHIYITVATLLFQFTAIIWCYPHNRYMCDKPSWHTELHLQNSSTQYNNHQHCLEKIDIMWFCTVKF